MTFLAGQILTADDLNVEDTGWVNITIETGFAAQGADLPAVRRVGNVVYARGAWSSTGISINTVHTVGTLPVGTEPSVNMLCRAGTSTGAAAGTIFVTTTGSIQVRTGGTLSAYYFFGGQAWLTD